MSTPIVAPVTASASAKTEPRTQILCVDDEPNVLEGLSLQLAKRYAIETATSGIAGLEALRRNPSVAVVMSDMRMPGMDGATFLSSARRIAPSTVRVLLTGYADLQASIAAVNEGQIFRFLTKPCLPKTLLATMEAAVEQHRLITSERVLLEQTLHGSIKALVDVLALADPVVFGRATRIKTLVGALAEKLELPERWQVEVAAMFSQLGLVALPAGVVERLQCGTILSPEEQEMVDRVPAVTEQLLGSIPRLEVVRAVLTRYGSSRASKDVFDERTKALVERGAQLLHAAIDFDVLEAQGNSVTLALDTMRGRVSRYSHEVLNALLAIRGDVASAMEIRELPLAGLRVGMIMADDVRMPNGTLLVARGYDVTAGFIQRLENSPPGTWNSPFRVIVAIHQAEAPEEAPAA